MNKRLGLGLVLLCLPLFAAAQNLSYNYFEVGLAYIDVDDLDDGIGPQFELSFTPFENWHGYIDYNRAEVDIAGVDIDVDELFGAVGYHWTMSEGTDLLARAGWYEAQSNVQGFNSVDDEGPGVEFGVRTRLGESMEGGVRLRYVDLDESDEGSLIFDGQYELSELWALDGELKLGEESNVFSFGLRLNF